jgi:hypothetical protein
VHWQAGECLLLVHGIVHTCFQCLDARAMVAIIRGFVSGERVSSYHA